MTWLYVPRAFLPGGSTSSPSAPASADWSSASELPSPERAESLTWRGKPQPPQAWSRAWRRGGFIRLLSGLTLEPSTLDRGVESFIASLAETLASPTASPAGDSAPPTIAGSSTGCSGSSKTAGRIVSSGKTSQGMRTGSSPPSSRHWKQWVSALRSEYSARKSLRAATAASACSSWPTAKATSGGYEVDSRRNPPVVTLTLAGMAAIWGTPRNPDGMKHPLVSGRNPRGRLEDQIANWSTPTAHDGRRPGADLRSTQDRNLSREASTWSTPAARDYRSDASRLSHEELYGSKGEPLARAAQYWPTPDIQVNRDGYGKRRATIDAAARGSRRSVSLHHEAQDFHPLPQARTTPAGSTSPPPILSFYRRFRATTDLSLSSEMRALLRMAIRSRPGLRVEGLRRPIYSGWTRRRSEPFVRPSFRRRLNPTFVEWLMRMPFGLSGFEREATELTRWLERMRGCLSTLHSASIERPQGRLL